MRSYRRYISEAGGHRAVMCAWGLPHLHTNHHCLTTELSRSRCSAAQDNGAGQGVIKCLSQHWRAAKDSWTCMMVVHISTAAPTCLCGSRGFPHRQSNAMMTRGQPRIFCKTAAVIGQMNGCLDAPRISDAAAVVPAHIYICCIAIGHSVQPSVLHPHYVALLPSLKRPRIS